MDEKKKDNKGERGEEESIKISDFQKEKDIPETYRSLVSKRLKDREGNIMAKLSELDDGQLRFTVRIFADCMEEADMERFLDGYSEYMVEDKLLDFVGDFVPEYTSYAVSELEAKKAASEGFAPEQITGEELQEMSIVEKWPKLAEKTEVFSRLKLRREIAKLALLLRPYMLTDPGWNESLLEFAIYFDIQEKLKGLSDEVLHTAVKEIAPIVLKASKTKEIKEKEKILREIRSFVLTLAEIDGDVEELLGPPMERYPREAPEGWDLAEFRHNLEKLGLKEVRLSALVYIDLLTLQEMNDLAGPFMEKFTSFYDIDKKTLIEFLCTLVPALGDREVLNFYERYTKGKMMVTKSFSPETWNLLPREKKLQFLREDNDEMDIALMGRHIARIYLSEKYSTLYNYDFQIELVQNPDYMKIQGALAGDIGGAEEAKGLRELNDEVTVSMLDVVNSKDDLREKFSSLRKRIASTLGFEI
jgi:hypothetical protein